jgi:putative two-component system response regulator
VALADVFDALISHRVYRPALTPASARQLIAEKAGSQFDPDLAAVFLSLQLEDLIEH